MVGLSGMPASGASLLLNAEGVFTAVLAWVAFRENVDRRIALGMAAIPAGALVLSWPSQHGFPGAWPALCILGACLAWALDNNLTRKVSLHDASWIACVKGFGGRQCEFAARALAGRRIAGAARLGRRHAGGTAGVRREPGAVRGGPAGAGHSAHRCVSSTGALLRRGAGPGLLASR